MTKKGSRLVSPRAASVGSGAFEVQVTVDEGPLEGTCSASALPSAWRSSALTLQYVQYLEL